MGRLGKATSSATRPMFRVHYRKLVDDYTGSCDTLKFIPALPEFLSYNCCQCGHMQQLQVGFENIQSILKNFCHKCDQGCLISK